MVKISFNTCRDLCLKLMVCDVVDQYQDFGMVYCLYLQNVRLGAVVVVKGLDTAGYPGWAQDG
jgi:hypothetical protein